MLSEMIVRDLAEQCLLERALNGDKVADTEASARAMAGSFRCQVGLLQFLGASYAQGRISADRYLEGAEVLARMAAATGDWVERRRLAAILDVKAHELRKSGADNASKTAHVECVILLTRLADEGDDEALSMLDSMSAGMHQDAVLVANMGLKAVAPAIVRPAPPASEPAPSIGERLSAALGPEWEPTRWERARWWLSDICWSLRLWLEDRAWGVRLLWWRVRDRIAAFRGGV